MIRSLLLVAMFTRTESAANTIQTLVSHPILIVLKKYIQSRQWRRQGKSAVYPLLKWPQGIIINLERFCDEFTQEYCTPVPLFVLDSLRNVLEIVLATDKCRLDDRRNFEPGVCSNADNDGLFHYNLTTLWLVHPKGIYFGIFRTVSELR